MRLWRVAAIDEVFIGVISRRGKELKKRVAA